MPIKPLHKLSVPRVHFGNLPKPNHRTGSIIYFLRAPARPFSLRDPAHGRISQRRVQARDEEGDAFIERCYQTWLEENPEDEVLNWNDVRWDLEAHPGTRVMGWDAEESVSPTTMEAESLEELEGMEFPEFEGEFTDSIEVVESDVFTKGKGKGKKRFRCVVQ